MSKRGVEESNEEDEKETRGERLRILVVGVIFAGSISLFFIMRFFFFDIMQELRLQEDASIILLTITAAELAPILWFSLSPKLRSMPRTIETLASEVHQSSDLQHVMHKLQIYEGQYIGRPAHIAAIVSINNFLKAVEFTDNEISIEGDYSARELYEAFWTEILKAQSKLHRSKTRTGGIRVYLTHSASIRLWETKQFREIKERQNRFAEKGGEIYRILVHTEKDLLSIYKEVLESMRGTKGIHAFYLPSYTDLGSKDYFFCSFGGRHYAFIWTLDREASGVRGITKTEIAITQKTFKRDHHRAWTDVVEALEDWRPDEKLDSVLQTKPEKDVLKIMRSLS